MDPSAGDTGDQHARRDRRATVRVGIRVRVELCRGLDLVLTGWARNISLGGIFVESPKQFPAGSECILKFQLREGRTLHNIQAPARVAWRADTGMGLTFLKLADPFREVIARLVDAGGRFPDADPPRS